MEETRKKCFIIFLKVPIMICKKCPGITQSTNVYWKPENPMFHLHSCLKVDKLKCYIGTSLNKKNCNLKLHNSLTNCHFWHMSRHHAGNEFTCETT